MANTFASEEEFQACLNAQYNGVELESCQSSSTQTQDDSSISTAFESKRIVAKGGDLSSFASIVEQFDSEDKSGEFNEWINSLSLENYVVVGGNTDGIWKVIEDAVDLTPHTLNDASSVALSDDAWRSIAWAMEDAYDDYAAQLAAEQNSMEECDTASGSFECESGSLDEADCVCTSCSSALECCGLIAAVSEEESWWKQSWLYICIPGAVVLLCCIAGCVVAYRKEQCDAVKSLFKSNTNGGNSDTGGTQSKMANQTDNDPAVATASDDVSGN